jgi:glycosyltransferase involved in cell wall biosynthesis
MAMRVCVYTDDVYRRANGRLFAERTFSVFVARLARRCERLMLLGRFDRGEGPTRHLVGEEITFVPLPYYETLARPWRAVTGTVESLRQYWRVLGEVDCVWLLGPHPLAIVFAVVALAGRRKVVLGVRQDFPAYVRLRHPRRLGLRIAASILEATWRALARFVPVVVVGPDLGRRYRRSRRLLEIAVSLVENTDVVSEDAALSRDYAGRLQALSVGRIEAEKNPLLLADVLAEVRARDSRWEMVICGWGDMVEPLERRLSELGVAGDARIAGFLPLEGGLIDLYRESHSLLHVSLTEGLPQVILEAFAAGLPVVATDVGGIRDAVGELVLLVPADRPGAAADALAAVGADPALRRRLIRGGLEYVAARTIDAETARVAGFLDRGESRL